MMPSLRTTLEMGFGLIVLTILIARYVLHSAATLVPAWSSEPERPVE